MTRSALFTAAATAVAVHVADDSFLQPEPATSAADHLAGGLVPLEPPVLIIHNGEPGERTSHDLHRAVTGPKAEWVIPGSAHTGGATARPREYEQRVAGFFGAALRANELVMKTASARTSRLSSGV